MATGKSHLFDTVENTIYCSKSVVVHIHVWLPDGTINFTMVGFPLTLENPGYFPDTVPRRCTDAGMPIREVLMTDIEQFTVWPFYLQLFILLCFYAYYWLFFMLNGNVAMFVEVSGQLFVMLLGTITRKVGCFLRCSKDRNMEINNMSSK